MIFKFVYVFGVETVCYVLLVRKSGLCQMGVYLHVVEEEFVSFKAFHQAARLLYSNENG